MKHNPQTAEQALQMLKDGNARFVEKPQRHTTSYQRTHPNSRTLRHHLRLFGRTSPSRNHL